MYPRVFFVYLSYLEISFVVINGGDTDLAVIVCGARERR